MTNLEGNHGAGWEVISSASSHIEASGLTNGTNQTVGEEDTHTVRVSQGQDVDVHLGSTREGDATNVSGDDVDVAVWHSDGASIGVDDALVVKLQQHSIFVSNACSTAKVKMRVQLLKH